MKKQLFLAVSLTASSLFSLAQDKPVRFGLKAGLNLPTIAVSGEDKEDVAEYKEYLKSSASYFVGATADFFIGNSFSVQPGLTLSGKGSQLKMEEQGDAYTHKTSLLYLEIPVNALARFSVGQGSVFLGGGPYYGIALNGKTKWEERYEGDSDSGEGEIEFGSDDNADMKRGDLGLNLLAGYELPMGLNLQVGYGLGFANIRNDDDFKINNRVLSIGIGFSF